MYSCCIGERMLENIWFRNAKKYDNAYMFRSNWTIGGYFLVRDGKNKILGSKSNFMWYNIYIQTSVLAYWYLALQQLPIRKLL